MPQDRAMAAWESADGFHSPPSVPPAAPNIRHSEVHAGPPLV